MARPGLDKNAKFRRLCHMLGEPRPHVRGYLELLWEVAYEDGNPVIGDAATVEAACEFPGEPGRLSKALLECGGLGRVGFIEPAPENHGALMIHDLYHHCPSYVKLRHDKEESRRQWKACQYCGEDFQPSDRRSVFCSPACRSANWRKNHAVCDASRDGLVTDRNGPERTVTQRDLCADGTVTEVPATVALEKAAIKAVVTEVRTQVTERNATPAPAPAPAPKDKLSHEREKPRLSPSLASSTAFDEFWQAYPNKQRRLEAHRAWAVLFPDAELQATILAALGVQSRSRAWLDGYVPMAHNWLAGHRWEDKPPPEKHQGKGRENDLTKHRFRDPGRFAEEAGAGPAEATATVQAL